MNQERIDQLAKSTYLEKCSFNDECDFCDNPKNATFVRKISIDDWWWICGHCLTNVSNTYPDLKGLELMKKLDDLEDISPVKLPF